MLAAISLVACGASTSSRLAPWAAAHPSPAGVTFHDSSDGGLCAITARYPDEAPAVIERDGQRYVQKDKGPATAPAGGSVVGTSGDWTVYNIPGAHLVLVTASASFDYSPATGC
jgi:hypothetical protein